MMKKLLLFLTVTVSLFASENKITLNDAIKIAQVQYEQALSANYPSIDAILYANRAKEDGIFQQRGTFTLPSEFTKTLALADTLSISDPTTRAAAQDTISATPH